MRPPVIARRRVRTTNVVLFGLLIISVLFLLWNTANKHNEKQPEEDGGLGNGPASSSSEEPLIINSDKENVVDGLDITDDDVGKFPRILCMVPSRGIQNTKFRTILDTWGQWCDGIRFMIDPPQYCEPGKEHLQPEETTVKVTSTNGKVTGTVVYLNKLVRKGGNCFTGVSQLNPVTNKQEPVYTLCRHIWEKVWRSWVYIADHLLDDYDFFFKVDDDTFFFVPTMREILIEKGFRPEDYHYFGQKVYPINPSRPIIAGGLVGFSRATLRVLAPKYKEMPREYGDRKNFERGRCVDRDGATEEITTSRCLRELGIEPEPFYDETVVPRRPHIMIWKPRDMFLFTRRDNSSSWFYKHAPRDVGTLENCCSDRAAGFHFMRHDADLRRIYDLVVDPAGKKELELTVKTKVPQWKQLPPGSKAPSILENTYTDAHGAVLEAEYWLRVKEKWHAKDPKERKRRLYE